MINIEKNHPINVLYLTVCSEITNALMNNFERMLEELQASSTWTVSPPSLIDYFEEDDESRELVHVFGCGYELYSSFPSWDKKLPRETDIQQFKEVEILLARAAEISKAESCDFEVQLNQTFVGRITPTRVDRGITEAFIGEWRKALGLP